jgi:hypothetical protein
LQSAGPPRSCAPVSRHTPPTTLETGSPGPPMRGEARESFPSKAQTEAVGHRARAPFSAQATGRHNGAK